jgi:pimeloyl-ACP methyl ester carboxylesterase
VRITETAVTFGGAQSLIGIVTDPQMKAAGSDTAVVLLNPGIVHRVGPGRIYVKIARAFAALGFTVLRFDFSGIGDSPVRRDNLQFEKSAIRETQDAMDFLARTRGIDNFVLLGGCSGAQIALNTAAQDERVAGALLINFPIAEDEDDSKQSDLANRRRRYYYRNHALRSLRSWGRLMTGQANYRKIAEMLWLEVAKRFGARRDSTHSTTDLEATLQCVVRRGAQVLFLCSEADPRREDLLAAGGEWFKRLCASGEITLEVIPRCDHTFSSLKDQDSLLKALLRQIEMIRPVESQSECISA